MDAVTATVTEAAEVVNTNSRGKRVVINFSTEFGNEAKIWCNPDDDEGRFANSLAEGEQVMLMKGSNSNGTYYTFATATRKGSTGPRPLHPVAAVGARAAPTTDLPRKLHVHSAT